MEDQAYKKLIKSYDLETLTSVQLLIDRDKFQHRFDWVGSEIEERKAGIGPECAPDRAQMNVSRDEQYAGIFYRLPALTVDLLVVYIPFGLLFNAIMGSTAWFAVILLPFIYPAYQITCTIKWGQSAGKYLLRIVVIDKDCITPLHLRKVVFRHAPDLCFALLMAASISFLITSGYEPPEQASVDARVIGFHFANQQWDHIDDLWDVWIWSEIFLITLDAKRRCLHELLSDTLVVHQAQVQNLDSCRQFEPSYYDWLKDRLAHLRQRWLKF